MYNTVSDNCFGAKVAFGTRLRYVWKTLKMSYDRLLPKELYPLSFIMYLTCQEWYLHLKHNVQWKSNLPISITVFV